MARGVPTLAILLISLGNLHISDAAITADGCGSTKTCFRNPDGCELSDSECKFYSWAPADEDGTYLFELSGGSGGGMEYVAMALAMKNQMSDADLYYCDGKAVRTGTIQARYTPPVYNEMKNGLQQKSAATVNGVAQCSFIRPASVVKTISNNVQKDFDITKEEYYLLAAIGPMAPDSPQVQKHTWRLATGTTYNFAATPGVDAANPSERGTTLSSVTRDKCGVTKSCTSFPDANCAVGTPGCFFYSWQKQTGGTFTFEMVGGGGSGEEYIAIALGTQSKMTDADVYYCDGMKVRSGVIRDLGVEPAYVATDGLSTISAQTINGVAQCVFSRPGSVTRQISGGSLKNFDLNAESYFLLAASGKMNGEKIQHHTWQGMTENRVISSKIERLDLRRSKFFASVEESLSNEDWILL